MYVCVCFFRVMWRESNERVEVEEEIELELRLPSGQSSGGGGVIERR